MSVNEVLILSIKDFNKRQRKSQSEIQLEFPQFYPQGPDFMSIIVNNFQKMLKI